MKLKNQHDAFLAKVLPLAAITAITTIIAVTGMYNNKVNKDEAKANHEMLINKIETLNKVNSMYEASYKTGFDNCIKLNPEPACSKRYTHIKNHFSNEYNTKLLQILAEQSGIQLSVNVKTGKVMGVGYEFENDNEPLKYRTTYSVIYNNAAISSVEEHRKNEISTNELYNRLNKYSQDFDENKDEVVSIGSKFAELGLKAQRDAIQEFDTQDLIELLEIGDTKNVGAGNAAPVGKAPSLMDTVVASGKGLFGPANKSGEKSLEAYKSIMERLELEEAKNSGAGSASGIGKAPSLMDTINDSGQRFFNNVVLSPYNEAIISVSGCNGEELKTEFCIKFLKSEGINFPRESYIEKVIEWTNDEYEQSTENKHAKSI